MKSQIDLLLGFCERRLEAPNAPPDKKQVVRLILSWVAAQNERIQEARNRGQMVCDFCFELTPIDVSGTCRLCRKEET